MNRVILTLLILVNISTTGYCQRYASISANNINASFCSDAILFGVDTGSNHHVYGLYEVPKGSGRKTIFSGEAWLTGLDMYHDVMGAFNLYNPNANFRFGPVAYYNLPHYDSTYRRVYKMTSQEIRNHRTHYADAGYVMPSEIAEWPGNGNTVNGEPATLAPFADLNGNQIYEPLLGEYPDICGDDAVFMMINDSLGDAFYSCNRMRTEIHILAYSFQVPPDSILYNTTFIRFTIFNKSSLVYHDVKFSGFFDTDIGCFDNDRIGCDTALNTFFAYNDPNIPDRACSYGLLGYDWTKVAQGFTFLNNKLSAFSNVSGGNDGSYPSCNNVHKWQSGQWYDGTHITVGGNGYQNSNDQINYMYPGDPRDSTQWSELHVQVGSPIQAGDRRMAGSISFDTLRPGESRTIDMALITAFADSTAPSLSEIGVLKQNIQKVQGLYNAGLLCQSTNATSSINYIHGGRFTIYPNPASTRLNISQTIEGATYSMTDIAGRDYEAIMIEKQIDISALASGMYFLHISDETKTFVVRFVKE